MQRQASRILPINIVLFVVGLMDLLTTVFWLQTGRATEVNPIMATVLKSGLLSFLIVKLSTLFAYVTVMEWYRRRRSAAIAQIVGNITVLAYCGIYTVSFICVNCKLPLGM